MTEEEKEAVEGMIKDVFFWKGSSNFVKRSEYKKLVEKLYQENKELKEDNSHQWEERCRLTFELERLQEEKEKINKVADKMYEYISYYGWEDFESNTGCNREEMVDYFYKE